MQQAASVFMHYSKILKYSLLGLCAPTDGASNARNSYCDQVSQWRDIELTISYSLGKGWGNPTEQRDEMLSWSKRSSLNNRARWGAARRRSPPCLLPHVSLGLVKLFSLLGTLGSRWGRVLAVLRWDRVGGSGTDITSLFRSQSDQIWLNHCAAETQLCRNGLGT